MRRPNQEANVHRTVTEESVSPSVDINTANELKAGIVVLKSKLVCVWGGRERATCVIKYPSKLYSLPKPV